MTVKNKDEKLSTSTALSTATTELVESASSAMVDPTATPMDFMEAMELSPHDIEKIKTKFTKDHYIRPYEQINPKYPDAAPAFYFRLLSIDAGTVGADNKACNFIGVEAVKDTKIRLRFLESAGMRGQFAANRIGKEFYMMSKGSQKSKYGTPLQLYMFAWEP